MCVTLLTRVIRSLKQLINDNNNRMDGGSANNNVIAKIITY